MKLGVATVVTDEGIRPDVLAKALEDCGFSLLVVAERHDPFVALTAAALATSKLMIGPGVLLLPQRDRIQTAKAVSSLDQISAGRLLLGLGLGFDATYRWSKPVQQPLPNIYFGGFTAATISRARRHHAGWMPMAVPVADMVPAQLSLLDGATDIPVSVIVPESAELALLDAYRQHGAQRAFFLLSSKPESETLQLLDSLAALTETYS